MQNVAENDEKRTFLTTQDALNFLSREQPLTKARWDTLCSEKPNESPHSILVRKAIEQLQEVGIVSYAELELYLSRKAPVHTGRDESSTMRRSLSERDGVDVILSQPVQGNEIREERIDASNEVNFTLDKAPREMTSS